MKEEGRDPRGVLLGWAAGAGVGIDASAQWRGGREEGGGERRVEAARGFLS